MKSADRVNEIEKQLKNSPSSRSRTSDLRMSTTLLQSFALPTELSKERVCTGANIISRRADKLEEEFIRFDDNLPFER